MLHRDEDSGETPSGAAAYNPRGQTQTLHSEGSDLDEQEHQQQSGPEQEMDCEPDKDSGPDKTSHAQRGYLQQGRHQVALPAGTLEWINPWPLEPDSENASI